MYRLQTQWVNCSTQSSYLASLATWTDAAKDYYFNTGSLSEREPLAEHPFQLGDAPWVIRSHAIQLLEQRRYHSCTDYRTPLGISTCVTRIGRTSLDLEHEVYHEERLLCKVASSIIVFSPETGKPVAHGLERHKKACSQASEIDKYLGEEPPVGAFYTEIQPRFSDLDGHGHVNNAVLLSYLQDARAASKAREPRVLEDVAAMYVEFLGMAGIQDLLSIQLWPHAKGLLLRMTSGSRVILRARLDLHSHGLQAVGTSARPSLQERLATIVARRKERGLLRSLTVSQTGLVDFCSNDYLGFARSEELAELIDLELKELKGSLIGSTGSRLLSGNSSYAESLEQEIAQFHGAEAALLFNSGFDLNLGLFGCLPQVGDVVLYDELIHQSVREGLKLCRGKSEAFKHNDCRALEALLARGAEGNLIVAVESVYSMDGHVAPLGELCRLCRSYGASLIVDEAHGTGVYGQQGRGLVSELHLEKEVFCRVHTFGKAMGVHGAAVLGSRVLCQYLTNYAWPLVYSTSLPMHSLASIRCAYRFMQREAQSRQEQLRGLIGLFQKRLKRLAADWVESASPIQGIIIPGNGACVRMAEQLRRRFQVLPIRSPTVPAGKERLRIILHAHNSLEQVDALMDTLEAAIADADEKATPLTARL